MRSLHNFFILTAFVILPAISSASGRVIWDVSHTPLQNYHPEQDYSQLASLLEGSGYSVTTLANDLETTGLWSGDIFVVSALSNYETPYTNAEIDLIARFVEGGGGLLILSDNNASRPRNLQELARRFGVITARDDRIGNLSNFSDNELFSEVEEVALGSGSALEIIEQGGAEPLATDGVGNVGIAGSNVGSGRVIVIGDANLWTNDYLTHADNAALALNVFVHLDREALGRIYLSETYNSQYLPVDRTFNFSFVIENTGDGLLEYEVRAPQNAPLTFTGDRGLISTGESSLVELELSTADFDPSSAHEIEITIYHNDPTNQPVVYILDLHLLSNEPSHFDIPPVTGVDHSLLITSISIADESAPIGLEVGVFTPNGYCAGAVRYFGEPLGLAVRGDDPFTDQIDGFRRNEVFRYVLFTPWDNLELPANQTLIQGEPSFIADGFSVLTLDGRTGRELTLSLGERWSLVSLNIIPVSRDPRNILAPLLEADRLMMVKDGEGRFWDVARNFSNLGDWNLHGAYQIKVRQPCDLTIAGAEIDASQPIHLRNGWNSVAFLPQSAIPIEDALASLGESVEVVKRGDGGFYLRRWNWDGIGAMEPGYGYQIRLSAPGELVYPAIDERVAAFVKPIEMASSPSDQSMSLLIVNIPFGAEINVYSGNNLIGRGNANDAGQAGIPLWIDDPSTNEIEGAHKGAQFSISVNGQNTAPKWLEGVSVVQSGEIAVADFANSTAKEEISFKARLSPNPFNDRATLSFAVSSSDLRLEVFDLTGRNLLTKEIIASTGSFDLPAGQLPSGVLVLRLSGNGTSQLVKALHLP